jgi:DDE superfamily endonuclease
VIFVADGFTPACLKPGVPGRFCYRMRVRRRRKGERRSMSEADYADLITAAHRQLAAPVVLTWGNLNTHISKVMREFTSAHPDWLTVVQLPAYAPELNPRRRRLEQHEERPGQPCRLHPGPARRNRPEPVQENPASAWPHHRIPRPDQTHPNPNHRRDQAPAF